MNFADILVLAVIAVILFFCVRSIHRNFRSGGGCMGCPDAESCRREQDSLTGCSGGPRPEDIHIKKAKKQS